MKFNVGDKVVFVGPVNNKHRFYDAIMAHKYKPAIITDFKNYAYYIIKYEDESTFSTIESNLILYETFKKTMLGKYMEVL